MYNYVLVMSAIKGDLLLIVFFFFFFFFFLFLDIDGYVLYQCSFEIFYAIKVVYFYLYFIYLKNMGKIFHIITSFF